MCGIVLAAPPRIGSLMTVLKIGHKLYNMMNGFLTCYLNLVEVQAGKSYHVW